MYASSRRVCGRRASPGALTAAACLWTKAACFSSQSAQRSPGAATPSDAAAHDRWPRQIAASRPMGYRRPRNALDDSAVAIFNDVVRGGPASVNAQAPMSEWDLATTMRTLAGSDAGAGDKLARFEADVWPHLECMRGQIPKHLWVSTMDFLTNICDGVIRDGLDGLSIPLSRICARVGKMEPSLRCQLLLGLCHRLATTELESPDPSASPVLDELIDFWKHVSQLRRPSQNRRAPLRFVLPAPDEIYTVDKVKNWGSKHVPPATRALASIFVQFRVEEASALVPPLLATLAILSDARFAKPERAAEAAPLLSLVAAALQPGMPDQAWVADVFQGKVHGTPTQVAALGDYVRAQWPQASAMLQDVDAPWRRADREVQRRLGGDASSGLGTFQRQLRLAYRARNTGAIVSVWQDLRARLTQRPGLAKQMREAPEFFDYCIFIWCAVRRPAKLRETLQLMEELRIQPTIRSYTAMMHGWKVCKDTDKVAALWEKLVESGIKLDVVVWTERISGLIEGDRPQAGLRALAEMMALWKKAVKQHGPDGAAAAAVEPSIEVVNAVFKGLVRLDEKAAHEVLAWARRHGIKPNVRTYNALIRQSFRGTGDDVQVLLREMTKCGVEPDAATFTIILEEVLATMHHASAAEQVQAVHHVLSEIKAAGLRPNVETYGKMLYAVASLANGGADDAIAAVQRHMRDEGLAATPHMVTILLERALARDPPAPDAVQAILREHGLDGIAQGDQTLWERVASAHASTGDCDAAMAVFSDLARAGRPLTSLPCLTDIVRALLVAGRHADARQVVASTVAHKAAEHGGLEGHRYWRHHFWHMAGAEGLLDWDTLPLELRSRLGEQS